MLEAIKEHEPNALFEDFDVGDDILQLKDTLVNNCKYDALIELVDTLRTCEPTVYEDIFPYLCNTLVTMHLFRGEKELALEAFAPFIEDPEKGIDYFIPLLLELEFYGHIDEAVAISKKVHDPIRDAKGLIGGAELEFNQQFFGTRGQGPCPNLELLYKVGQQSCPRVPISLSFVKIPFM